jgi:hypothetical protein
MKEKIIGIILAALLIATVSPALGFKVEKSNNVECDADLVFDPVEPNSILGPTDVYEIFEGQYLKVFLTGYWDPPNPTKIICLWADGATMPTGATLTPPCNCSPGSVTSVFEWTPTIGQAGTYNVVFYLGETCFSPLGSFSITIIVHPSGTDNPPIVVIQTPADGSTFSSPDITVTGYATDDYGLTSYGKKHEWTGDQQITSGTLPTPYPTNYPFSEPFTLEEGWNRITIFVSDTSAQDGEDSIEVYYVANSPPNKPGQPDGPTSGKTGESLHFTSFFSDPDSDSMEVFFDWGDGSNTGWVGPVASGNSIGNYHTYTADGTYQVRTKARDLPHLEESDWSDPLSVTTPRSRNFKSLFVRLLEESLFFSKIFQLFNF